MKAKSKNFEKGDIVYALDRYNLPGNSRPLKTVFFPSPFIIIETFFTTSLIERLADKFRTLISNNDIKKFKNNSKIIKDLPEEIQKVLLGDFKDIIEEDISKIAKIDPLEIPPGIFLKNEAHLDQKKNKPYEDDISHLAPDDDSSENDENCVANDDDSDEEELPTTTPGYRLRPRKVRFKD